jgi:hypothetical protein
LADFVFNDPNEYTAGGATGYSVGQAPAAQNHGGVLALTTPASATAPAVPEAYVTLVPTPCLVPGLNRTFFVEARLFYTEVGTNQANVFFGLASTIGSQMISGGTLNLGNAGAGLYKVAGGTVWQAQAKNGATSFNTTSIQASAPDGNYHILSIEGRQSDALNYEITYFVDGIPLLDTSPRPNKIKHLVPFAGMGPLAIGVYALTGTNAALTVWVDYLYVCVYRV